MDNGVYQNKVLASLAKLETKMDGVCIKLDDHEKRLRFLEKGIWIAVGALIVVDILLQTVFK